MEWEGDQLSARRTLETEGLRFLHVREIKETMRLGYKRLDLSVSFLLTLALLTC